MRAVLEKDLLRLEGYYFLDLCAALTLITLVTAIKYVIFHDLIGETLGGKRSLHYAYFLNSIISDLADVIFSSQIILVAALAVDFDCWMANQLFNSL